MATQGVDGTSMRDLAAATGLNVASLYHYFPSKRDLLVAVLAERGFVDELRAESRPSLSRDPAAGLADLLNDILQSMLEVEDFIRLMMGEVMRGDDTAFAVGNELFDATQASLEVWLSEHSPTSDRTRANRRRWPACCEPAGGPVLRARGRRPRRPVHRRTCSGSGPTRSPPCLGVGSARLTEHRRVAAPGASTGQPLRSDVIDQHVGRAGSTGGRSRRPAPRSAWPA